MQYHVLLGSLEAEYSVVRVRLYVRNTAGREEGVRLVVQSHGRALRVYPGGASGVFHFVLSSRSATARETATICIFDRARRAQRSGRVNPGSPEQLEPPEAPIAAPELLQLSSALLCCHSRSKIRHAGEGRRRDRSAGGKRTDSAGSREIQGWEIL